MSLFLLGFVIAGIFFSLLRWGIEPELLALCVVVCSLLSMGSWMITSTILGSTAPGDAISIHAAYVNCLFYACVGSALIGAGLGFTARPRFEKSVALND